VSKEKLERRVFEFEMRADDSNAPKMVGHAALFNSEADLGYFREVIEPGAFTKSIGRDDVRALFNHDPNFVLGRNKANTLRLSEDEKGLAIEVDPPDTQWARDLMVSMRRGDITQMSFGFIAKGQRSEKRDGVLYRIITEAQLFDVSPVTYPAYQQTDVTVRSAQEIFDEIAASGETRAAEDIPSDEPPVDSQPPDWEGQLSVYRKRLELVGE
jgi:uncharacterized protein